MEDNHYTDSSGAIRRTRHGMWCSPANGMFGGMCAKNIWDLIGEVETLEKKLEDIQTEEKHTEITEGTSNPGEYGAGEHGSQEPEGDCELRGDMSLGPKIDQVGDYMHCYRCGHSWHKDNNYNHNKSCMADTKSPSEINKEAGRMQDPLVGWGSRSRWAQEPDGTASEETLSAPISRERSKAIVDMIHAAIKGNNKRFQTWHSSAFRSGLINLITNM